MAAICVGSLWSSWYKEKAYTLPLWISFVLPECLVPTEMLPLRTLPTPLAVKLVTATYKPGHAVMTNTWAYHSEVNFLLVFCISVSQLWTDCITVLTSGLNDDASLFCHISSGHGKEQWQIRDIENSRSEIKCSTRKWSMVPWPELITWPRCGLGSSVLPYARRSHQQAGLGTQLHST